MEDVEYDRVGGLIVEDLEDIGESGERVEWNNFVVEVVDMEGGGIEKVVGRMMERWDNKIK